VVLGEALGVARVVQDARARELGYDPVDQVGLDPLVLEVRPELGD
jgi:hypothetical protein